jgi:enamine deaminase RidA (YjgF/YER057c/UK114 family)
MPITARLIALAATAVANAPSPAAAQTRAEQTVVRPADPGARKFQDQYGYSDAVIAGDTIYLSGIVAGLPPGDTDMAAAFDRAYRHIGAVLKRAGADYGDIVEITSFHTDVNAQIEVMSAVHKKYVQAPYPAWTAIDVDRLLPDTGIAEIKIIARKRAAR